MSALEHQQCVDDPIINQAVQEALDTWSLSWSEGEYLRTITHREAGRIILIGDRGLRETDQTFVVSPVKGLTRVVSMRSSANGLTEHTPEVGVWWITGDLSSPTDINHTQDVLDNGSRYWLEVPQNGYVKEVRLGDSNVRRGEPHIPELLLEADHVMSAEQQAEFSLVRDALCAIKWRSKSGTLAAE